MAIQFAMVFPTEVDAQAAVVTLRAAGYRVDVHPEDDGSCLVSALGDVAASTIPATRVWMQELAHKNGGDFLGHGGVTIHGLGG
jgi:hypothetical protein